MHFSWSLTTICWEQMMRRRKLPGMRENVLTQLYNLCQFLKSHPFCFCPHSDSPSASLLLFLHFSPSTLCRHSQWEHWQMYLRPINLYRWMTESVFEFWHEHVWYCGKSQKRRGYRFVDIIIWEASSYSRWFSF